MLVKAETLKPGDRYVYSTRSAAAPSKGFDYSGTAKVSTVDLVDCFDKRFPRWVNLQSEHSKYGRIAQQLVAGDLVKLLSSNGAARGLTLPRKVRLVAPKSKSAKPKPRLVAPRNAETKPTSAKPKVRFVVRKKTP